MNQLGNNPKMLPWMMLAVVFCVCLVPLAVSQETSQEASPQDRIVLSEKSSDAALNSYADAVSFHNNGAYDVAIEEWEKFLTAFEDDPLAPKAQYYLAICNLQLKEYTQAESAFQATIRKYPPFELTEDAFLNLGWCQFTRGAQDPDHLQAAVGTFNEMLQAFPKEKGKRSDQALYYLGDALYAQGKRIAAIRAYDRLVKNHENSSLRADAIYALGVTQQELQDYPAAGIVFDLFLQEFVDQELATEVAMRKAETVLQAGIVAAEAGQQEEAQNFYKNAEESFALVAQVEGFALADHAIFRQAYAVAKQEDFNRAGTLFAKVARDYPVSSHAAEARISAARNYFQAEDFQQSLTWFQKTLDAEGVDMAEAAHWICRIHLRHGEAEKAVQLADKILPDAKASSYFVALQVDQADAVFEIKDRRSEAEALYAKIVADHPQHALAPQALYNAAFTALELKNYEAGINYCETFVAQYEENVLNADVKYLAAECHLSLQNYTQAKVFLNELIQNYAGHDEIDSWRVRNGFCSYLQKNYRETIESLLPHVDKLRDAETIAEAKFYLGASRFYLEEYADAIETLTASHAVDPTWRKADEALLFLSRAQRRSNAFDDARATVQSLIDNYTKSSLLDRAWYRLGEYHYAADDFEPAVLAYDKVLGSFEASAFAAYAHFGKGWAHLKLNAFEPAKAVFSTIIADFPDHSLVPEAKYARAICKRQLGEFSGAVEDVTAYLETELKMSDKSNALYERGLAEVGLKDFDAAVTTFTTLLRDHAQYASADRVLYELGWAYKAQEKERKAADQFAALAASYRDSSLAAEAFFHVGEFHYKAKEFTEAALAYRSSKERAQGETAEKAVYKYGWSQFRLQKFDEALVAFTEQLAEFETGDLAADGAFMKAQCLFKLTQYEEAYAAFQVADEAIQLAKDVSTQIKVLTLLRGAQSASQLEKWDESCILLNRILGEYAESVHAAEAFYERGYAHQKLDKVNEALEDYEVAATTSRGETGARARFMIGQIHFSNKAYNDAVKSFQRVMFGFGGENADAEVKPWQARSGFEAARCAEVQIKSEKVSERKAKLLNAAKKWYGFVVEKHPGSELVDEAQKRLKSLSQL